jgi:cobalt-zinc-cadmium efflux system outer membrane protein
MSIFYRTKRCARFFVYRKQFLLSIFLCLAAQPSLGQSALSLQQAIHKTLANNPQLHAYQWRFKAIEGQKQTADLSPAYELGIDAENAFTTGADSSEYTVSISSVIELGGKREARVQAINSRYSLAEAEKQVQSLDLIGEVTNRYIEVLSLQEKMKVSEQAIELAQNSLSLARARVDRGAAPKAELYRAQSSLAQAKILRDEYQGRLASSRLALATLWRAEQASFGPASADLFSFETASDFESLYQRVIDSPNIQIFAEETRLKTAELEVAQSQSTSNLSWSLGIKRMDETNDSAITAGVSMPLFSGKRNQGQLRTARAELEMVEYNRVNKLLQLRSLLFKAWSSNQQSVAAANTIKSEVLPDLEEALLLTQQAYESGRYSYLDWTTAQKDLLEARMALIETAKRALLSQSLIEQLTATSLSSEFESGRPYATTPRN